MLLRFYFGLEPLFEIFLLRPSKTFITLIILDDLVVILATALQMLCQFLAHIFGQSLQKIVAEQLYLAVSILEFPGVSNSFSFILLNALFLLCQFLLLG